MPKIGTIKLKFRGDYIDLRLNYSRSNLFYVTGVPEEFVSLTGFSSIGYKTESALEDSIERARRLFIEKSKSVRYVIAYAFSASPNLRMNKERTGMYSGTAPGVSGKIYGTGFGAFENSIGFTYNTYAEITDGSGNKSYHFYNYEKDEIGPDTREMMLHRQIMDFSPVVIMFFKSLEEQMKKMVRSISEFVDIDPGVVKEMIESGEVKLLSYNY